MDKLKEQDQRISDIMQRMYFTEWMRDVLTKAESLEALHPTVRKGTLDLVRDIAQFSATSRIAANLAAQLTTNKSGTKEDLLHMLKVIHDYGMKEVSKYTKEIDDVFMYNLIKMGYKGIEYKQVMKDRG